MSEHNFKIPSSDALCGRYRLWQIETIKFL